MPSWYSDDMPETCSGCGISLEFEGHPGLIHKEGCAVKARERKAYQDRMKQH